MKISPINTSMINKNIRFGDIEDADFSYCERTPYQREMDSFDSEIHHRIDMIHYFYPEDCSQKQAEFKRLWKYLDRQQTQIRSKYTMPKFNWFQKLCQKVNLLK